MNTTTTTPAKFKILKLREDEILYREGDVSQSMYLVKTGMISVYNQKRGKNFELVRIQAGQLIGELAFFNPQPRTSHAKALVETELIEISFQEVQKDFEKFPGWVKILLNTMSSQVIKYSRELKQFRVADESDPEALNALVLRSLGSILQAADIYGEKMNDKTGDATRVSKASLKQIATNFAQVSPNRMNALAKALGTLPGFEFKEDGDEFELRIESLANFRNDIKTLGFYVQSYPQLLLPGAEDSDFLLALAKMSESVAPNHKGLAKVYSAPVIGELKALNSKANMTTVDSLIDLGIPIQKVSGAEGVELVFPKDDILALQRVWNMLAGIYKQNPFKGAAT